MTKVLIGLGLLYHGSAASGPGYILGETLRSFFGCCSRGGAVWMYYCCCFDSLHSRLAEDPLDEGFGSYLLFITLREHLSYLFSVLVCWSKKPMTLN